MLCLSYCDSDETASWSDATYHRYLTLEKKRDSKRKVVLAAVSGCFFFSDAWRGLLGGD